VELYLHSPNTPSLRGVQLKIQHRDNFTFTLHISSKPTPSTKCRLTKEFHVAEALRSYGTRRYITLFIRTGYPELDASQNIDSWHKIWST
jgi:uncharacterized protein YqiB (DUF1249 family)